MWFHPYGTIATIAAILAAIVMMGLSEKHVYEFWASISVTVVFALGFLVKNWVQARA